MAVSEVSAWLIAAWTRPPDWSADVTKNSASGVQWRGTVGDITTRHDTTELARRISRARTTLSECHRALTRATDEQELLDDICRIAVGLAGYSLAWVGFAEDDERKTVRPVARYGEAAPYLDEISVTWGDNARGRGPTGTAIRTGRVRLARDLVVEPGYGPWRATAARYHLASSLSLPLLKDDLAFGGLEFFFCLCQASNEVLFIEESQFRNLPLTLAGVPFTYAEIESCVALD